VVALTAMTRDMSCAVCCCQGLEASSSVMASANRQSACGKWDALHRCPKMHTRLSSHGTARYICVLVDRQGA
jgi:lipocalin